MSEEKKPAHRWGRDGVIIATLVVLALTPLVFKEMRRHSPGENSPARKGASLALVQPLADPRSDAKPSRTRSARSGQAHTAGNPAPNRVQKTQGKKRDEARHEARPPKANPPRQSATDGRGLLAIVIDDLGHNLPMPRRFIELGLPLTYSILPGEPYTAEVVSLVRGAGGEFMLHLPMEPQDYPAIDPGKHALLLNQDDGATRARLIRNLDALRGAVGVNNHMGSAYTNDPHKMAIVQAAVAKRGMIFLNSKTSASPVPGQIARRLGYRYLERDIFLDHVRSEGAIATALKRAIRRAREKGRAIAIGHPYPETLRVLRRHIARGLERQVRLVSLSEL